MEENKINIPDDAVLITYPDGHTEYFESVSTASTALELTPTIIKSLCNRKGAKSQDGIKCAWANLKSKRSKLAKKNRHKGNAFELEVIKRLKEIGYVNCVSSRSQSKRIDNDKIDIIDLDDNLPINLQTKYTYNFPSYFEIRDICSDKSKPFGVIWKKSANPGSISPGTVAVIPFDFFCELLKYKINEKV